MSNRRSSEPGEQRSTFRSSFLILHCSWLVLALVGPPAAHAQLPLKSYMNDPGTGARSHDIDQLHMVVEVAFEPEQGLVRGTVTHHFAPLRPAIDSLYLDGPAIRYREVRLNGRAAEYRVWPGGISIYPEAPLAWDQVDTLTIAYEARPQHGLYFVGWNDPNGESRKQIWTQGQGPGHRYWVPLYDAPNDRLLTETIVTFDADYRVLSNGERVSVRDNGDGTRTWHYRMTAPHAGYLMMLGIGDYGVREDTSAGGIPLHLYYYPDQPERVEPTYRHTGRMLHIMEEETGVPYPWSSYAQIPVHDFLHGGMENTTATVFSDAYYVDSRGYLDRNYITVNAHEVAHQWFGDLVTQGRNEDIWLHESFATHYAKVVERRLFGEDHYQWNRKLERDQALSNPDQGPIPIRSTRAGSDLVYYKGSLVLDMLKDVAGKAAFDRVIRHYLQEHAYGHVIGPDFFHAFDRVLGLNLDWFFEQWIRRGGEPHYRVTYRPLQDTTGAAFTEVTVEQIHETGPLVGYFRMPVDVEVHHADGGVSATRAWVDSARTVVRVANPEQQPIDFVLFDAGHRIVKRLTFERSVDERVAQALRAPGMIDRYDALVALRDVSVEQKREALAAVVRQEAFPEVRAEALRQLAGDPASLPLLADGLRDPAAAVRAAVLQHAPAVVPPLVAGFERALRDSSYDNVLVALVRLAAERPSQTDAWLEQARGVDGLDHAVRVAWLEIAARTGRPGALDELVALAGPSYGFRTRLNAFGALERMGFVDPRLAGALLDAAAHFNRRLRQPAVDLFRRLAGSEPNRRVFRQAYETLAWSDEQAARLRPLFGE